MPCLARAAATGAGAQQQHACSAAIVRSSGVASTSARAPAHAGARRSGAVKVRAQSDAFCRDKVSLARGEVKSEGKVFKVSFMGADGETKEVECPDNMYILEAAERGGLDLPATCRGGICGACVVRVAKGEADQSDIADLAFTVSEDEQAQGMTLICMARAKSDLVIETQSDWGYSLGVGEWKGATGRFSATPDPLVGESWADIKKSK